MGIKLPKMTDDEEKVYEGTDDLFGLGTVKKYKKNVERKPSEPAWKVAQELAENGEDWKHAGLNNDIFNKFMPKEKHNSEDVLGDRHPNPNPNFGDEDTNNPIMSPKESKPSIEELYRRLVESATKNKPVVPPSPFAQQGVERPSVKDALKEMVGARQDEETKALEALKQLRGGARVAPKRKRMGRFPF